MLRFSSPVLGLLILVSSGCETPVDLETETTSQFETWHAGEAPTLFDPSITNLASELPLEGEVATIPWAANYWPIYQDSINYRWGGSETLSPTEKYAQAFGIPDLPDAVSREFGVDKYRNQGKSCTTSSECDSSLAEECSFREGNPQGACIPTWFGICHAWAPVAIMEPEPVNPVTINGVTFEINDIKAYLTILHNHVSSRFVSMRCNANDSSGEIEYDEAGRPLERGCRDSNPGAFHVLIANYLGLRKESFVYERVFDFEVWNQPLRGYKINEQRVVTATEANELLNVSASASTNGGETTTYSTEMFANSWFHLPPVQVAAGQNLAVQLTGVESDLYVRFGAQPDENEFDCRPFSGMLTEDCNLKAPSDGLAYVSVKAPSLPGAVEVKVTVGGQASLEYAYNAAAAELRYVQMDVQYIAESPAHVDGNLSKSIDAYTHTDNYEYILELDGQGHIIGGEWVGSSKRSHPDFLWLPTGRTESAVVGGRITYAQVKQLLDLSINGAN